MQFSDKNKSVIIFAASLLFVAAFTALFAFMGALRLESFTNIQPDDNAYFRQYFFILTSKCTDFSIVPPGLPAPHFSPIIYVLAPIYKLFPYLKTLFVIQSCIILTGIYPVYGIMRFFKNTRPISIIIALFYVFNPFTIELILNDFRFMSISLPFILAVYYFYLRKKLIWFLLFSILALSCREELVMIFPFLWLLHLNKNNKASRLYLSISVIIPIIWYFGIFTFLYNPEKFSQSPTHPSPYILLTNIFGWEAHYTFIKESLTVIITNITNPKILFSLFMLYRPKIIIPLYAIGILTSTYGNMYSHIPSIIFSPQAHYNTIPLAFIFLTFMFFITNLKTKYKLFITNAFLYFSFFYFLVAVPTNICRTPISLPERNQLHEYTEKISADTENTPAILADEMLTPMLANQPLVFLPYSIPADYPAISRIMQNIKYILIKKERIERDNLEHLLEHTKEITETKNYYLIKYHKTINVEPYLTQEKELLYLYQED